MLRAKGGILGQKFPRKSLILVLKEQLYELKSQPRSSRRTNFILSLLHERVLKDVLDSTQRSAPVCTDKTCRSGCKTTKCPCRVAGHRCGALCHPKYYKR